MGDSQSQDQGEHELDLLGGLWPLPNLKQAHLDIWWFHNFRPKDKSLLLVQYGQLRNRAAQLQNAHTEQFLPEIAKDWR